MKLKLLFLIFIGTLLTTGCDAVYDDQGDCSVHYIVKFRYDYNILEANAFPSQVEAVVLRALDPSTGEVVKTWTESGEKLRDENYAMEIDIPAGTYDLHCWAGSGAVDASHFLIDGSTLECKVIADGNNTVTHEKGLKPLFYGIVNDVAFTATEGVQEVTVPLMKDTNYLSVALVHLDDNGSPMTPGDYDFNLTSSNGIMARNNELCPSPVLNYKPFAVTGQSVVSKGENSGVHAEFITARLMEGDDTRLTVNSTRDGREILSLPITQFLLALKGNYNEQYNNQEYLDRQDRYQLTFFLSDKDEWIKTVIYINSWRVVLQYTDM